MRILSTLVIIAVIVIVAIMLGLIGCSRPAVQSDRSPEVDFSRYRTFQWTEYRGDTSPEVARADYEPVIMDAVSDALTGKGFQYAERDPDILVAYHIVATSRIERDEVGVSPARPVAEELIDRYEEGTLILDLIDPELGTVIWRGWSLRGLDNLDSPESADIDSAVDEILDQYPKE